MSIDKSSDISDDKFKDLKNEYDSIELPPELDFAIERGIKRGKGKSNLKNNFKKLGIAAATFAFISTSGVAIYNNYNTKIDVTTIADSGLPSVGSATNLKKILKDFNYNYGVNNSAFTNGAAMQDSKSLGTSASKTASSDYSPTNVQVKGVDEDDIVKTDGEYIYRLSNSSVLNIVKANPASSMTLVTSMKLDSNFIATGMYIKGDILVLTGNQNEPVKTNSSSSTYSGAVVDYKMGYMLSANEKTKIVTYDISDVKNIKKLREVKVDGYLSSSRIIGNMIYVISNKSLYNIADITKYPDTGKVFYDDSAAGNTTKSIGYDEISYIKDALAPNYIVAASFDITGNKEVQVEAVLGNGSYIYSSTDNMYVAGYNYYSQTSDMASYSPSTTIYKFSLNEKGIKYVAKGKVDGNVLNQFSMDEYNGEFRVATSIYKYKNVTADEKSSDGSNSSSSSYAPDLTNAVYVLDSNMKTIGSLKNLAKDEQIYSVRFMGDRAYIVTFMLTDPLFVIDLSNGAVPKVLGELKIPGYSTYMQPYDETHIIGFGLVTETVKENGMDMARPTGMKMAIFDVSDVSKPVQMYEAKVGTSGTYSNALYDYKALLFSKEKNLLVIPVDSNGSYNNKNVFQGMYVYNIDLVNGFKLKGKITHLDLVKKDKNGYFDYNYMADRSLYIDNVLYTISNGAIKANSLDNLEDLGSIKLKLGENGGYIMY